MHRPERNFYNGCVTAPIIANGSNQLADPAAHRAAERALPRKTGSRAGIFFKGGDIGKTKSFFVSPVMGPPGRIRATTRAKTCAASKKKAR